MKHFSHLSIIRGIGYLLVFTLCVNCKKDYDSPNPSKLTSESILESSGENLVNLSQTRTASRFNDWPPRSLVNAYSQSGAQYVAYDDNSYAYTKKLTSRNWYASLVLQGFGFTVPSDATIENIIVSVRRFKKGKASISDYFANLVKSPDVVGLFSPYGVRWTNPANYPDIETEVIYSQSGTGNNGGSGNQFFQWTPVMINDPDFGVRIDVNPPVGAGSVVVYYDLVEITVEYSLP